MGTANSKPDKSNALKLCKDRKKFVKQAIDSRYALAAAHISYIQSLRNIGTALRRYAEAEVLIETSLSTSATSEPDNPPPPPPPHSSYPSPSPSHLCSVSDTPISPQAARASYMRSSAAPTLTVRLNPNSRNVSLGESEFSMPPHPHPPPPLDESGSSWDYFDPSDESFKFVGQNGLVRNMDDDDDYDNDDDKKEFDINGNGRADDDDDDDGEEHMTPKMETPKNRNGKFVEDVVSSGKEEKTEKSSRKAVQYSLRKNKCTVEKDICEEREDPCEFVTHRAKDFLSSIKDIDNRFFRASESGKEVSRMLESNKIHVVYAEARGASSCSICLPCFGAACCQDGSINVSNGASEFIQQEYDRKCDQLRHQFAKDLKPQVINKTRAAIKDLHSRIRVALHAVDTISKRIEKMRDEELLPQLLELINGLTRMWKAMLECHHSQ
ncbi:hypothetical protein OROGR_019054 [Orobanche gracilis]